MIAMMIAIDIGMKYQAAIERSCVGIGADVAAGWSTANAVVACEGQYDSLPGNIA